MIGSTWLQGDPKKRGAHEEVKSSRGRASCRKSLTYRHEPQPAPLCQNQENGVLDGLSTSFLFDPNHENKLEPVFIKHLLRLKHFACVHSFNPNNNYVHQTDYSQ